MVQRVQSVKEGNFSLKYVLRIRINIKAKTN
jgi:hypothetical protein